MISFPEGVPVFLRTGPTDMRKSINGLAAIIQQDMGKNPFEAGYYVFCNKTRHLMKLLYWDKTGFALWYKRLEKEKFPWPEAEEEVRQISREQMTWLLEGIDFFKAHKRVQFSTM